MRTLAVLLALSGVALAQEQTQDTGRFYGPWFSGRAEKTPQLLDSQKLRLPKMPQRQVLTAELGKPPMPVAAPQVCSVPLIEAPIRTDVEFTMQRIVPRPEAVAPMPQARVPAPPCESATAR